MVYVAGDHYGAVEVRKGVDRFGQPRRRAVGQRITDSEGLLAVGTLTDILAVVATDRD